MKMILPLLLLALIISATGCKKAHTPCGVSDPTTDIPWVKRLIADHGSDSIQIYTTSYHSGDGILVSRTGRQVFYTCDSVTLCTYSGGVGIASGTWLCTDGGQFDHERSAPVLIYSSY